MLSTLFVFAAALLPHALALKPTIKTSKAIAFQSKSPDNIAANHFQLWRHKSSKGYNPRSAAHLLGHSSGLTSLFEGEEFATDITFGEETFSVIVDTGSSDSWMIETGFSCVDIQTSAPLDEAACGFGPTYNVSKTFREIPNENFKITYGDGEFLRGRLGWEEVTLAGITVNQTFPVVNYAAWNGDGITSGLVGLAYPALAFTGTNATNDTSANRIPYDPIFTTMYKEHKIAPVFSLAILRDISGPAGYLSLGGLPPVDFIPNFVSTPILITSVGNYPKTFDFYTITLDSIKLGNKKLPESGGTTQYIVDSGTTLNYFPTAIADAINAAFVPPAVYDDSQGAYVVDCNATAPALGITIGGYTFGINPLDMILGFSNGDGTTTCISGIDDGGSDLAKDLFILGDTFQKNVVSVFDVGAGQMRFAAREFYPSNDPY